jgi:hypothetical protein
MNPQIVPGELFLKIIYSFWNFAYNVMIVFRAGPAHLLNERLIKEANIDTPAHLRARSIED